MPPCSIWALKTSCESPRPSHQHPNPTEHSGIGLRSLSVAESLVNTGFACILEKFEYDCFGGRNLRVWFESYLRSHSFNGLASLQSPTQSVKPVGLMPAQLLLSAPAPSRPSPRRHKCSSSF